ncbi:MAG: LIC_10190 family membrane protein [Actinomycetes bacterium]
MGILAGSGLVLVTWVLVGLGIVSFGLLPASLVSPAAGRSGLLRRALWWGLLIAAIEVCAISLLFPLHSSSSAVILICSVLVLGVPGWIRWSKAGSTGTKLTRAQWLVVATFGLSQVYLAVAALGPVTGYDSGLYHLGAIKYASEFGIVPGLANLYGPLAYATAEFPMAAVLGNGPWGGDGFRLLNGLILGLVAIDLVLRTLVRRVSPGYYVLLAGMVATWVPMVALSDFWVTSPSQDSAVLALTVVCTAYVTDACLGRKFVSNSAVAVAIGIALVLIRSTMAVYVIALLLVLAVLFVRRRRQYSIRRSGYAGLLLAGITVLAALTMTMRDYLLSGWLQYPLSTHPFDVPWRAPDPEGLRLATLGFARDPAHTWDSVTGWGWVGSWVSRLPHEWAFVEFCGVSLIALAIGVVAVRTGANMRQWRPIALATFPSAVAVLVWWVASPPAFRFAWGPLFTLATVPLGGALWLLTRDEELSNGRAKLLLVCAAVPVLAVTMYSGVARLDLSAINAEREWNVAGLRIPYAVAPVINVPVQKTTLESGLVLVGPTESDQCWDHYPLCTPQPLLSLRLRADSLAGGFLP